MHFNYKKLAHVVWKAEFSLNSERVLKMSTRQSNDSVAVNTLTAVRSNSRVTHKLEGTRGDSEELSHVPDPADP